MSKTGTKKKGGSSNKGQGQGVAAEVGALLSAYKASCKVQNLKPLPAVVTSLEKCGDDQVHYEKVVLSGPEVDDRSAQALLDALAGYPKARNLCFWRCSIGDRGLARLACLIAAASEQFYNGPKIRLLEVSDDSAEERQRSSLACSTRRWEEDAQAPDRLFDVPLPRSESHLDLTLKSIHTLTDSCRLPMSLNNSRTSVRETLSFNRPKTAPSLGGVPMPRPSAGITALGLGKLAAALRGEACPLKELSLDHNDIGNPGLQALVSGLRRCSSLQRLSLAYNKITAAGATSVAEILDPNCAAKICYLNLQGNPLGSSGLAVVARALVSAPALVSLSLADTGFGRADTGVTAALCEGLKESSTITKLDLSLNDIGSENAGSLLQVFTDKPTIVAIRVTERIERPLAVKFAALIASRAPKPRKKAAGKRRAK